MQTAERSTNTRRRCHDISIKRLTSPEDIAAFWEKKREYDRRDLYPTVKLSEGETLEELKAYFDGPDYYQSIMAAHRERNAQFVFFYLGTDYLGFALYKVYTPEFDDTYLGEAMLLEFCIDPSFRNQGLGAAAYARLADCFRREGGQYTALNTSNDDNLRFWTRLGFTEFKRDEWGNPVYRKSLGEDAVGTN